MNAVSVAVLRRAAPRRVFQRHSRLFPVPRPPSQCRVHQRKRVHANGHHGIDSYRPICATLPTMDHKPVSAAVAPIRKLVMCRNRSDKRERERLFAEAVHAQQNPFLPPPVPQNRYDCLSLSFSLTPHATSRIFSALSISRSRSLSRSPLLLSRYYVRVYLCT